MSTKKILELIPQPDNFNPKEKKVFEIVKKILDKADIQQLLLLGAPGDEYDPEARLITLAIVNEGGKKIGATELAHIIALVFHTQYESWGKPIRYFSIYFDMAKELQKRLASVL